MRRSLVTFLERMFGINRFINGPVCYADKISISSDVNSYYFLFRKRFIVTIIKDWSLNTLLRFLVGGGIRPNRPLFNLYFTIHIWINIASSCESRTGFSLRERQTETQGGCMWCDVWGGPRRPNSIWHPSEPSQSLPLTPHTHLYCSSSRLGAFSSPRVCVGVTQVLFPISLNLIFCSTLKALYESLRLLVKIV